MSVLIRATFPTHACQLVKRIPSPAQAAVSAAALFSARFLLIARLPLPLSSVLLSHVASLFIVLAVPYSPQEREQ